MGGQLGVYLRLSDFGHDKDPLKLIIEQRFDLSGEEEKQDLKKNLIRLLVQGRVTFLLDSLDQAGEKCIAPFENLVATYPQCNYWISGRPYAFRNYAAKLRAVANKQSQKLTEEAKKKSKNNEIETEDEVRIRWQFFRIGPLEEPEARQLLEMVRARGI